MLIASGAEWGVPFDMMIFVAGIFIAKGLLFLFPFDYFSLFDVLVGIILVASVLLPVPSLLLYILAGLMFLKVINSLRY